MHPFSIVGIAQIYPFRHKSELQNSSKSSLLLDKFPCFPTFFTLFPFFNAFFPGKSPGSLQTRLPQSIQALLGPRPRGAVTHNSGRGRKPGDLGTEDVFCRPECYWKWPIEIVDLPNLKMVMLHSYVSLPEGIYMIVIIIIIVNSWY